MSTRTFLLSLTAIAIGAGAAVAGPPFAERASSGKSLRVPAEHERLGTVYHALPGKAPQIHFRSDAPLEDIQGQSNEVIGYVIASGNELEAGEWHLPVESLRTGIPLRDEHLASEMWLDADDHPNIVFQLQRVRDVRPVKEGDGFKTLSATLVGEMTIHGVTRQMRVPKATIVFMNASDRTARLAKGDLVAIRASYSIALADYDVSHQAVRSGKVAREITIDTQLYMSTVPPEQQ